MTASFKACQVMRQYQLFIVPPKLLLLLHNLFEFFISFKTDTLVINGEQLDNGDRS